MKISWGFLTGNIGDVAPDEFESRVNSALSKKWPDAKIYSAYQAAEGVLPSQLQTDVVGDTTGKCTIEDVDEVIDDAWNDCCINPW